MFLLKMIHGTAEYHGHRENLEEVTPNNGLKYLRRHKVQKDVRGGEKLKYNQGITAIWMAFNQRMPSG